MSGPKWKALEKKIYRIIEEPTLSLKNRIFPKKKLIFSHKIGFCLIKNSIFSQFFFYFRFVFKISDFFLKKFDFPQKIRSFPIFFFWEKFDFFSIFCWEKIEIFPSSNPQCLPPRSGHIPPWPFYRLFVLSIFSSVESVLAQ
jgi:hypothetical protein